MRSKIDLTEIEENEAMRMKILKELNATPNEELKELADEWRTLDFDNRNTDIIGGKRNKDKIECADELESKIKNL